MSVVDQVHEKLNNGDNWMKGDATDGVGNYCILGALHEVAAGSTNAYLAGSFPISIAIKQLFPDRINPYDVTYGADGAVIANFNDDDDTTWEDVSLVLKYAAKAK